MVKTPPVLEKTIVVKNDEKQKQSVAIPADVTYSIAE